MWAADEELLSGRSFAGKSHGRSGRLDHLEPETCSCEPRGHLSRFLVARGTAICFDGLRVLGSGTVSGQVRASERRGVGLLKSSAGIGRLS